MHSPLLLPGRLSVYPCVTWFTVPSAPTWIFKRCPHVSHHPRRSARRTHLRVVVHALHAVGLQHAVLVGQVLGGEGLRGRQSAGLARVTESKGEGGRTPVSDVSPSFLPMSLVIQSWVALEAPPMVTGSMRGMLVVVGVGWSWVKWVGRRGVKGKGKGGREGD